MNLARQHALIDHFELVAAPAQRVELRLEIAHQITRSLPPSMGIWAPVVLANKGPHISAASAATSLLVTSVFNTLLRLYSSTLMPYRLARSASTAALQMPVSKTALGCKVLMR